MCLIFYCITQGSNSKIDIWKEKNTENSSPLINNKRIALRTRLFIVFLALAIISSVLIISHTQNEVLAKKTTGNKSGIDRGYDAASLSGNTTSSNSTSSSPSGNTTSSNSTSSSPSGDNATATDLKNTVTPVDETHCDKKGYPSCYDLGYSDGQNALGTSCPSGHSEAYCNGYEAASLSGNGSSDATSSNSSSSSSSNTSDLKNTAGSVDQTHCDKKGYPSCYDLGYSDGQNAPGTSCPTGHSETYCNGYEAASLSGNSSSDATSSNSSSSSSSNTSDLKNTAGSVDQTHCDKKGYPSCYDLGYSDGQNALGTSCPSGHSEAYCNGYEAASLSGNSSSSSSAGSSSSSEGNSDLKNT